MSPVRPLNSILTILCLGALVAPHAGAENWPGWRGPRGDGTSLDTTAPTEWEISRALWKAPVPGFGHASATVWDARVFTTTAFAEKQDRAVVCFDRKTGRLLWQQVVANGAREPLNKENSQASATPATDGRRVYVAFRVGNELVIAAHEAETGKQAWLVREGGFVGEWGFCNEPIVHGNTVILDGDSKGESFLMALNREDGKTVWRVDRTNKGITYSSPLIARMGDRLQLVSCGDKRVASFDPDSGKELWTVDGPSQEFVASPCYSEKSGLLYISSSWPDCHLMAIRPDGNGNVTKSHVVWDDRKGAAYVPSLTVAGDFMFSLHNSGAVFCYEAATGKVLWQQPLGRHHASPVLLRGLLFLINDNGDINVIHPAAAFESVAKYSLGEPCYASPAISQGQVFLRGFTNLFCLGRP